MCGRFFARNCAVASSGLVPCSFAIFCNMAATSGVMMNAGEVVFTRTPSLAYAFDKLLVRLFIAALDAL